MGYRRKIETGILLLVMAVWLLLMWRLSSADGTETLRDSMRFARKIGTWLYGTPTAEQLSHLNLILRKLAHVFLYVVFGMMSAMLWELLLFRFSIWKRAVPAILSCTVIAFLDELQKIPISGRHFSATESLLNAGSAIAVIVLYFLCIAGIQMFERRRARRK